MVDAIAKCRRVLDAVDSYYAMPPGAREWPASETGYGDTFGEAIAPDDWTMKDYGDRRRELVVAAALLLAEIERMDRAEGRTLTPGVTEVQAHEQTSSRRFFAANAPGVALGDGRKP